MPETEAGAVELEQELEAETGAEETVDEGPEADAGVDDEGGEK